MARDPNNGKPRTDLEIRRHWPHYVYRCYDGGGRLLYVGCTYNPPVRIKQHHAAWTKQIARVRLVVFPDRRKALDMERLAIETEHPLYNRTFQQVSA